MNTAGLRVRLAMAHADVCYADLARITGISEPTVRRIARDKGPARWRNIVYVAEALQVPAEWVMVGRNPPAWVAQLAAEEGKHANVF